MSHVQALSSWPSNIHTTIQTQASHKDEFDLQCEQIEQKQQELEDYIAVIEKLRQNLFANEMEVCMTMKIVY